MVGNRLAISLGITAIFTGCLSMQEPRTEQVQSSDTRTVDQTVATGADEEEPREAEKTADKTPPAERPVTIVAATEPPPAPPTVPAADPKPEVSRSGALHKRASRKADAPMGNVAAP